MTASALQFHQFGNPTEVLQLASTPSTRPERGQVRLRMLASPINPSDLGSIAGTYGELPSLPAIPGREGVGEVVEAGPDTDALVVGQRVLLPEGIGCWRHEIVTGADTLIPVSDDTPLEQAAMATINPPTAWLLLETFVSLQPGDWVIQNAANSAVGHLVIQLCRQRGVRTINIVRHPHWIDRLKSAGGDAVLLEGPEVAAQAREIAGGKLPLLGLNSVGGQSAASVIKALGEGGTLVTFGGMTGDPVRFPTRYLIFNDIRLRGFWLHRWKKQHSPAEKHDLQTTVLDLITQGVLQAPVEATYPLKDFQQALAHASTPGRNGKILFSENTTL